MAPVGSAARAEVHLRYNQRRKPEEHMADAGLSVMLVSQIPLLKGAHLNLQTPQSPLFCGTLYCSRSYERSINKRKMRVCVIK